MADRRFHPPAVPHRLSDLARLCGADLSDPGSADRRIAGVADPASAGPEDLCYVERKSYLTQLATSSAGACLIRRKEAAGLSLSMPLLLVDDPRLAFAVAATALYPPPPVRAGIAASAEVAADASIAAGAEIGPGVIVGAGAVIGERCRIDAQAVIGPGVVVGEDSIVGSHCSLSHCVIGSKVTLFPGVRIGQDGFGYASGAWGHRRMPHLGRVLVGDGVEIGANTTIDRGAIGDTVIGAGTIIDNQVQIGHNVRIGAGCILVAQAGIAGSAVLEDRVVLAAKAGVAGHVTVGAGASVAATSGVMRDVAPGERVGGLPAIPIRQYFKQQAILANMARRKDN